MPHALENLQCMEPPKLGFSAVKAETISSNAILACSDENENRPPSPGSSSPESSIRPITPVDETQLPPSSTGKDTAHTNLGFGSRFLLRDDKCVDDLRPLKVVVVGAGFSGITAAIRFSQRMKNVEIVVYEKNAGVGGTWFSSRYPGCACDFPAHCYQLSFEKTSTWSRFYAPAPEIRADIERVVQKYELLRFIRLEHELTHASYDEKTGKWNFKIRRPVLSSEQQGNFEEIEDSADLFISATGCLSRWKLPDIPGVKDFKGKLMHTGDWDTQGSAWWQESVKGWESKTVGVIGSGASTTQVVPALQPLVKHLYNYVRGKTWIAPPFVSDQMCQIFGLKPTTENHVYSEEEKAALADPEFFKVFRRRLEHHMNNVTPMMKTGSALQINARKEFFDHMMSLLTKKPWIAEHLLPDFSPTCRRLTPGPGYLEALQEENVNFVPKRITRIVEDGLILEDGTHHKLDVIVCATGYDTTFQYPHTIIGRNGSKLNDHFKPYPKTYLSLCTQSFPNFFMLVGPNGALGAGSLLAMMEKEVDYIVQVAQKMQLEEIKSIEPKKEAIDDFDEYLEAYFETTTLMEPCNSWYKLSRDSKRIIGLWPGSNLHAIRTLEHPRWEDYDFEYPDPPCAYGKPGKKNRFYWLGNGATHNELHGTGDCAWYLDDEYVDYPPVPKKEDVSV